jgi:hypothetical protein
MHPTQIFLSNPTALRVEYRLDDSRLILWWSPKAGQSTDCRDRNYSSRDAHLEVFESIELADCGLGTFQRCDYDPYHSALHFENRVLHLALRVGTPAVLLWSDRPLTIDFKSHRYDCPLVQTPRQLTLQHAEPRYTFHFAAALGSGEGHFRHCHYHAEEQPVFSQAQVAPGQVLAIGIGLDTEAVTEALQTLSSRQPAALLAEVDAALAPHCASGHIRSRRFPELEALRSQVIRGLHSMIDESGACRASLKAIYYLLWVRDSGFAFAYQAAAGWPHKLPELCRLLLDNPNHITDADLPQGRMFGQLIHRKLGKLEEDGLYYVVWTLFTQWTQSDQLDRMSADDWALIDEALHWVETVTWDEQRGLFGEFTADETAAYGHRDHGWDYAIGKPGGDHHLHHQGQPVVRNYDVYFNACMHSTYVRLAALRGDAACLKKAERLWPELAKLLAERSDGVPTYGELLLADGTRVHPTYWGPSAGASCCVWGLSMPNFLPLADWDRVHAATLDAIIAKPEMHFINGICAAMSAVDPWCYPEEKLLALHRRLAAEAAKPGKYLPMGGAMPEKFNAPEGNLYHDIRPQGFAMGAWLAAWSSLGLRRLPYGLALRPTQAFETISDYPWQGRLLHFAFGPAGQGLALEIDGSRIEGTLQLPQARLRDGSQIRLVAAPPQMLWLRSSVRLNEIETDADGTRRYQFTAFGLSSITFSTPVASAQFTNIDHVTWSASDGLHTAHFTHFGDAILRCRQG